jgi:hypothetical protein
MTNDIHWATMAVQTRYYPATDTKGKRVRATLTHGSLEGKYVEIPWSYEAPGPYEAHFAAVHALFDKFPALWERTQRLKAAAPVNNKGYIFLFD